MVEQIEEIEDNEAYKELSSKIDQFLAYFDAAFDTRKIWDEFNVKTRAGKQNVSKCLTERVKHGSLAFKYGKYKRIDKKRKLIDYKSANSKNFLPLKFPKSLIDDTTFGIENLVRIFPKSIIVLAGTKGATKTGWCLNLARENMNSPELSRFFCNGSEGVLPYTEEPMVAYFTNELSAEELRDRLEMFGDDLDNWNILPIDKYDEYAEQIYPDKVNIIDALEINMEAYRVADLIDAIHQKLNRGIAIIAMHKNLNAEYAAGGLYSAKKARLYLVIQEHTLLIKHSKKTVGGQTAEGRKWRWKMVDGTKYYAIEEVIIDEYGKEY